MTALLGIAAERLRLRTEQDLAGADGGSDRPAPGGRPVTARGRHRLDGARWVARRGWDAGGGLGPRGRGHPAGVGRPRRARRGEPHRLDRGPDRRGARSCAPGGDDRHVCGLRAARAHHREDPGRGPEEPAAMRRRPGGVRAGDRPGAPGVARRRPPGGRPSPVERARISRRFAGVSRTGADAACDGCGVAPVPRAGAGAAADGCGAPRAMRRRRVGRPSSPGRPAPGKVRLAWRGGPSLPRAARAAADEELSAPPRPQARSRSPSGSNGGRSSTVPGWSRPRIATETRSPGPAVPSLRNPSASEAPTP